MKKQLAAAAIVIDEDGRVLIAKRPEGKYMAGFWEFPGGKIEEHETPEEGLRREITEELGITLECFAPFGFISEAREGYHLLVFTYLCREWEGIPRGAEGQEITWVLPPRLNEYTLLPSNVYIVGMLQSYGL